MTGALVTGATTPVGRAVVEALACLPEVRTVLAVGVEPPESLPRWPCSDKIRYAAVDLTRSRQVHDLLFGPVAELGLDVVVHGAMHRDPGDTGREVRALNVESTRQLLHLAERHPTLRRLVFRSDAAVYRMDSEQPVRIDEEHPIHIGTRMPQWLRDRVEADVMVTTRLGLTDLSIAVLRFAEVLAPASGSQIYDYLRPRVCFRPLGFDPMLHLMCARDAGRAVALAARSPAQGVFNIGGRDILPLSECIHHTGRVEVIVPGPLLSPIYRLRALTVGGSFSYALNQLRFHFSGVLDGSRARQVLGYEPTAFVDWGAVRDGTTP